MSPVSSRPAPQAGSIPPAAPAPISGPTPVEALRRFHLSGKGLPRVPEGWGPALADGLGADVSDPPPALLERLQELPEAVRPEHPSDAGPLQLFWLIVNESVQSARAELRARVQNRLDEVGELIRVEEQRPTPSATGLADSIGAAGRVLFNPSALRDVLARKSANAAPDPERLERLRSAAARLRNYLHRPSRPSLVVVHSPSVEPRIQELANIESESHEAPIAEAIRWFDLEAAKLAEVVAAMRTVQLEFDGDYDVEKHGPWLHSLTWSSLTEAELHALPAVIALVNPTVACREQLSCLSRVLHGRRPLHILSFIDPARDPAEPVTPSRSARTELAALGLAHASAFIHQTSLAAIEHCFEGFSRARARAAPSLHLIAQPCVSASRPSSELAAAAERAAAAGRAHPRFIYDPGAERSLAHMFELGPNPGLESAWPKASTNVPLAGGASRTVSGSFTFVDFALLCPMHRSEFTPVASNISNEYLIPVDAYLEALDQRTPSDERDPIRLPTVWARDENGELARLVVSAGLCRAAVERQAFWRSLQEMAGYRNVYVEEALTRAREQSENELSRMREELEARHEAELAAAREDAARQAVVRLVQALAAGPEAWSSLPSAPTNGASAAAVAPAPVESAAPPEAATAPAPAVVSDDPWIESALCTTCGDCININGQLFVYDENKQAKIGDRNAGTFKDLVTAAEKCPSRCIHPGRPSNPNERNLDTLIERAKKFD